jgi:hypothetical protein
MYYVICKLQLLLRVAIHLGMHEHRIVKGMCKNVLEEIGFGRRLGFLYA